MRRGYRTRRYGLGRKKRTSKIIRDARPRPSDHGSAQPKDLARLEEFSYSGSIQGKKASEDEEIFYIASKMFPQWKIEYDVEVRAESSLPGKGKQIDFLASLGVRKVPIEIDGPFHDNYANKSLDDIRDAMLNRQFIAAGWETIKRIDYKDIPNPIVARDVFIKEIING